MRAKHEHVLAQARGEGIAVLPTALGQPAAQKADFHRSQDRETFEFNRFITLASQTVEAHTAPQLATSNSFNSSIAYDPNRDPARPTLSRERLLQRRHQLRQVPGLRGLREKGAPVYLTSNLKKV